MYRYAVQSSSKQSSVLKELPRRARIVYSILGSCALALLCRGIYLQTIHKRFLQREGEMRYSRVIPIPASRGRVMDRHGQILAVSTSVKSIWAIPSAVELDDPTAKKLADLLRMSVVDLKKKLNVSERDFIYIKRQVPPDVAAQITALKIDGIYQMDAQARYYPRGEEVAHMVGWTDVDDRGREGVELARDSMLVGVPGSRRVMRDRRRQIIEDLNSIKTPQQGQDLRLTLDSRLQFIAARELKKAVEKHRAKAGALVILDAKTGELLAVANAPSFNPNNRVNINRDVVRNRAFTDLYEPGSTMKPFAIAMALDTGKYKPTTLVATGNGHLGIGPAVVHDAHPAGTITVSQVIQKSSNVGASKIVLSLPSERLYHVLTTAGFGHSPHTGFPGEASGHLRSYKSWRPIEHATLSYGHGISVSLVQLAQAYTMFANEGRMLPVKMYMDELEAQKKNTAESVSVAVVDKKDVGMMPRTPLVVVKPSTAEDVRKMLELVTQPGGTALKARVVGYSVGGKTGTAHKLSGRHYIDKYVASFIGMAPISNPRLIIAVMIDEPSAGSYYGGEVAAPVFSEVMGQSLRTLGVVPDLSVVSSQQTTAADASQGNTAASTTEEVVKESD
jgi:cell division protein FtsI (penicillin-binding protein 3)